MTATTVSLDGILKKCGDLGRFQLVHFFFINLISMSAGVIGFYYVFGAAEPDHRCQLPASVWPNDVHYRPINLTHESLINAYIPKTGEENKWIKCQRFTMGQPNETLVDCPNGWAYDRSVFGHTFTEEANLVCHRETDKSWLATLMQCGGLSLLVIGSLADRFGRKRVTAAVTCLLFAICLTSQAMIEWLPMATGTK